MTFATTKKLALVLPALHGLHGGAPGQPARLLEAQPVGSGSKTCKREQGNGAVAGQVATIHFVGWIDEKGVRGT